MDRRRLLLTIPALFASRLEAAPQPGRLARIGWLSGGTKAGTALFLDAFRAGLVELGYIEGQNFVLEERYGENAFDRVPALADELAALSADVIVVQGQAIYIIGKRGGSAVPIVFGYSGDPVAAGFAESLAKPIINMTGHTYMSVELNGKRIELLKEILPQMRRLAIVANPIHPGEDLELADSEATAQRLGIEIQYLPARSVLEISAAIAAMAANPPDAIMAFPDALLLQQRRQVVDFALQQRIPAVSGWAVFAESGALFSYGPKLVASWRRLAVFADRILKGAKAFELPIERPTVFELVINLKTARAIGVSLPASVLVRADAVIE